LSEVCSRARCSNCGKTTWRGCGQHVDAVMAGVAAEQRCHCAPQPRTVWLARLRGR
jgi:hypothetical protein